MVKKIPRYALYGESALPSLVERLHCESISDRSRLHEWEIRPHVHDQLCQILLLRAGSAEVNIDHLSWRTKGPSVIYVPPLSVHGFRFSENADGLVLTVVEPYLRECIKAERSFNARFEQGAMVRLSKQSGLLVMLEALEREYQSVAEGRLLAVQSALTSTLVQLARLLDDATSQENAHGAKTMKHVQAFKQLVEAHFRVQRDIPFYASALGITSTQLSRLCRQHVDRTPLELIHQRLLLEAERDLVYTNLSIKEIAWTLGFNDTAYFTRFFSKQAGMPPGAFRERVLRGGEAAGYG